MRRYRMWRCAGTARLRYSELRLHGDGIELRPFTAEDAPRFLEIIGDPEIVRFSHLPDAWTTKSGVASYIESLPARAAQGSRIDLAVIRAGSRPLLGHAVLRNIDWSQRKAAVGTWVASEARGRGIAGNALRLLSEWALTELGLRRVVADPDHGNLASQRMLERIGFRRERDALSLPSGRTVVIYSLAGN